jgi:gliding motility-associated-like protein
MRYIYLTLLLSSLALFSAKAQVTETTYQGSVVHEGYYDDGSWGPLNIGFTFRFYGNDYTQFHVTSNGLVMFGSGSGDYTEDPIPSTGSPNNFIAAFWDDIVIDPSGKILYTTIGAAPNRKCIIQWTNMGFYSSTVLMGTFAVILHEGSNNIQVQYRSIIDNTSARAHGQSATIGLENSGGTAGVQYAYHNSSAIESEQAILFTPSGSTYTYNPSATYDGVYLTKNLSLPEPGIPVLVSPAYDAVVGSTQTFEWTEASNASAYTLKISSNSDISNSANYNAGTATSYDITGLSTDATYYWSVFASNPTGTTWSEIYRFTTSENPPLSAVPQTVYVEQNEERPIRLQFNGGDATAKTAIITSLPAEGSLYQYDNGIPGAPITLVPSTVSDSQMNLVYVADGTTGNGAGNFNFIIRDNSGDSPAATITVNVNPPGIPNFLLAARAGNIEIQFDKPMADPSGKESQFLVKVNGVPVPISSVRLKDGDPYSLIVNLVTPLSGSEAVLISYTQGNVTSEAGGLLPSFVDQPVTFLIQTITFAELPEMTFGDPAASLSASASSGAVVTFTSSNTSVATVNGTSLTANSPGTADITAYQGGNGTYAPARYIRTLTVDKADQSITFPSITDKTFGSPDFNPGASASSGLQVTYGSSNNAVATIISGNIHIIGTGTSVITASQPGNAFYNAAPDVTVILTVIKADQSITFTALPQKTVGDPDFSPGAIASSGLEVAYSSSNEAVATVIGNQIHVIASGTSVITASQAGNDSYNAAAVVQQTLSVVKSSQTITFPSLEAVTFGDDDFEAGATASSGLTVSYTSGNPSVATIIDGLIHVSGAGTAVITASQAGNDNFNAAPDAQQVLTVNKAAQHISFGVLPSNTYGDPDFVLSASSSSGLIVSFTGNNDEAATISGTTVHITGGGSVVITASQSGNENYLAAPDVQQTLVIEKASQSISFPALSDAVFGDSDINPGASASSGLNVTYSSGNPSVAVLSGGLIHIVGAGTAVITASQAGNDNFEAAADVSEILIVKKADQTISFPALSEVTFGDPAFTPGASASSGLEITYTTSNPAVASVSGGMILINAAGSVSVTASQPGNENYNAADDQFQVLTVAKAGQSIIFNELPDKVFGDADFELTAVASSSLPVTYTSSDESVATVNGATVHITGAGSVVITAAQAGNENYLPGIVVARSFVVEKAEQMISFDPFAMQTYGNPDIDPMASATSGLMVSYSSSDQDVAVVTGGVIHIVGAGTAEITASQAGDENYYSATDVTQVLTVQKADQIISCLPIDPVVYGIAPFTPQAAASSNLDVSYSCDNLSVAEITNNTVIIRGTGIATITASQTGNNNYNPAEDVQVTLTVSKAILTIIAEDKSRAYLESNPELTFICDGFAYGETLSVLDAIPSTSTEATANSPVGTYPIILTGGSDNNYEFNLEDGILTVTKIEQTVTFIAWPAELLVTKTGELQATASSGLQVFFESNDENLATVTGSILRGISRGNVVIRAYQPGDNNYYNAESAISVEIISSHANIMNLFTPNNDGFNDHWEISDLDSYGTYDIRVFNRWGKLVFSSTSYNNDWDGTSDGVALPPAAYYYVISTANAGTITGTVNIVR